MYHKCLIFSIGVVLFTVIPVFGQLNIWKGIVPFRSTKEDVIRILGACKERDDFYCRYEFENENVLIYYSPGRCAEGGVWNVDKGVVEHIDIHFTKPRLISDFAPDRTGFVVDDDRELPGIQQLSNHDRGIVIVIERNLVRSLYLTPPQKIRESLRCPTQDRHPS